ncbi:MAG: hypothetical protein ABSG99_03575 [Sedimentisphaerales bacterium]
MEEININKTRPITGLCLIGGLFIFIVYILITGEYNLPQPFVKKLVAIALIAFAIISLSFLIKDFFEDFIALLRFYNLRIEILRDKIILRTDTKECEIPMNKDTNVVCCMNGWLISWPSEKGQCIILFPRLLLGDNFKDLCFYFQEHTNYIPSRSLVQRSKFGFPLGLPLDYYQPDADYDAAEEDEKKLLKSLQINKWNRLKYIKWPS